MARRAPTTLRRLRKAGTRLRWAFDKYAVPSYSQEGEDRIIARIFEYQQVGTYVDVGAHHPRRFSNTYLLYLRGWSGLNVDPLPGTRGLFDRARPRDVNVESGVGTTEGYQEFFRFSESALSTFDRAVADLRRSEGHVLQETITVPVTPLKSLIPRLGSRSVDLLTIDVEGRDADVLESADLPALRPRVVCIESAVASVDEQGAADQILQALGYRLIAVTGFSRIFQA